jgi:hypothetical protein
VNGEINTDNTQRQQLGFRENLTNSKISTKLALPEKSFKEWRKITLERFVFHLKKINESQNFNYLKIDK